jgi:hypothetical protein
MDLFYFFIILLISYYFFKAMISLKNKITIENQSPSLEIHNSTSTEIDRLTKIDRLHTHLFTLDLHFENYLTEEMINCAYERKLNEHLIEIKNGIENTEYSITDLQLARDFLTNYYS